METASDLPARTASTRERRILLNSAAFKQIAEDRQASIERQSGIEQA